LRVLLGYRRSSEGRSSEFERLLPVGLCSLAAAALLGSLGRPGDAARIAPAHPEAHALLGKALARLGRKGAAEDVYLRTLALDGGHVRARDGLDRLAQAGARGSRT
jgi:hypothetical protein